MHKIDLATLPYAEGASWNPKLVCIDNTRTQILEDITSWAQALNSTKTAEIMWLTAVAGAGKSAIAHTVAKYCHQQGLLASSFFFDREISGRNGPQKLFSTIVRDLTGLNVDLAERIGLAIERDQSIATASPSRQFQELILDHSRWYPTHRPVVIVIDALDEGYDTDLLQILRDEVSKLPPSFRVLITSRAEKAIVLYLSQQPHILSRSIDLHAKTNLDDIGVYVRYKLRKVAKEHEGLSKDWPGATLADEFTRRAEGLFIWVSTVCDYLCHTVDPTRQLNSIVSNRSPTNLTADAKMDKLYLTILSKCNWEDEDFVRGYRLLMGAIMAAKTPLSVNALQSLHRASLDLPVSSVLRSLNSLLPGLTDPLKSQPVRVLHLSFRDFVTARAQFSSGCLQFYLSEREHSHRLALLCLSVLNQDLNSDTPGTGYLTGSGPEHGVPEIVPGLISEELWYACRFWVAHVIDIESPEKELVDALRDFLSTQVMLWVELTTSKGRFQKLIEIRSWLQVRT